MNFENFQIIDNERIAISITKRESTKLYHQHGAKLNSSYQNNVFIFSGNNNYHQIGNA